jgi:hypothetical protein
MAYAEQILDDNLINQFYQGDPSDQDVQFVETILKSNFDYKCPIYILFINSPR